MEIILNNEIVVFDEICSEENIPRLIYEKTKSPEYFFDIEQLGNLTYKIYPNKLYSIVLDYIEREKTQSMTPNAVFEEFKSITEDQYEDLIIIWASRHDYISLKLFVEIKQDYSFVNLVLGGGGHSENDIDKLIYLYDSKENIPVGVKRNIFNTDHLDEICKEAEEFSE